MESIAENEKTDITVDGLCVSYGDKLVLNRLSVRFRAGAFTFVLGPSGCGKTTLLNVLMGINRGFTGEVSGVPALMSAVFQEDRLSGRPERLRQPGAVLRDKQAARSGRA